MRPALAIGWELWAKNRLGLSLVGAGLLVAAVLCQVLPREVEEVIAALPGVAEVKVYPGRTRHGSLHVKAAVVADDAIDTAQVKAHCQEHLIYYKRPARIVFLDALPKSSAGKVLRDQLP